MDTRNTTNLTMVTMRSLTTNPTMVTMRSLTTTTNLTIIFINRVQTIFNHTNQVREPTKVQKEPNLKIQRSAPLLETHILAATTQKQ